jgi:hypothetical protein
MVNSTRKSTAAKVKFHAGELRAHVLLVRCLDRIPAEVEFLGNILDGGLATAPPDVAGKALGIKGVVCSPGSRAARASHGRNTWTARDAPQSPERYVRGHTRYRERTACAGRNSPTGVDIRSQVFYGGMKWFY